jgi:hypothetical protein
MAHDLQNHRARRGVNLDILSTASRFTVFLRRRLVADRADRRVPSPSMRL